MIVPFLQFFNLLRRSMKMKPDGILVVTCPNFFGFFLDMVKRCDKMADLRHDAIVPAIWTLKVKSLLFLGF